VPLLVILFPSSTHTQHSKSLAISKHDTNIAEVHTFTHKGELERAEK
jgi:hypothetical protein